MSAYDKVSEDQRRAREQLDAIWQVATDLAHKAGVEMPATSDIAQPTLRRSPGPFGYAIMAEQTYKERRLRHDYFDDDLFGEAAWDIMLDLYKQKSRHRQVSVTSACIASAVPPTTALRWIGLLVERGMLARTGDPLDRRRAFIELTQPALGKLGQYFEAVDQSRSRV
jgi:DNA-binding MarR family transcriptional regulator